MHAIRPAPLVAIVAVIFLLKWGAEFFVPLFVSLLISYALSPVVDLLARVIRLRVLAAAIVVLALVGALGVAAWAWSDDLQAIWQKVPVAARTVSKNVQQMVKPAGPITEVKKAAADIESAAAT